MGRHRGCRERNRTARRPDRRDLDQRPEHGAGYWGKPEESRETFQNTLKSRTTPSHAEGAEDSATWVRTGDYGAYHDGELFITGRVKDLVIVDGRNHYPQDLEYSAQEGGKAPHRVRRRVLGTGQPAARRGLRERPRRARARCRRQLGAAGDRGRRAPGAHKLDIAPITDDIRAPSRCATASRSATFR
jgi:fatty acid CoA ligase FadD32